MAIAAYGGFAYATPPSASHAQGIAIAQQDGRCTGTVLDVAGEPIVGAAVKIKGTSEGAVTDLDGRFVLNNVKPGTTLVVTYLGHQETEVEWNGRPLTVQLKENAQELNEVVVVGYGTQKKINVTGAVSQIDSKAIENRPVANVTQALQGNIPGLTLNSNTSGGMLNNTMSISIRGTGSIGNGSTDSPLVLIDGIEGNINYLNPNDIESVSVLKDAASASIYGARAAFGVILVTTKSGKAGKVKINYSGDVRFSIATQLPEMANPLDFAAYFNAANVNAGAGVVFTDEVIEKMRKYQNGEYTDPSTPEYYGTVAGENGKWLTYQQAFANTDWFDEFYKKNVPSTQHNLSLSGGNEKVNWLISGSFFDENGLIRHGHDELYRYTTNAKIGAQLASWARVDYTTKWTRQDYQRPQYLSGLFFHNIARRWPNCPVVDPNGHWVEGMEIEELEKGGKYSTNDDLFTQQLNFTFTPLEGWNIYAQGALRVDNYKARQYKFPVYFYDVNNQPVLRDSGYGTVSSASDYRFRQSYYAVNVYTDYTRSIGLHNFKGLLGVNFEKYKQDDISGSGDLLISEIAPYLSGTQQNQKVSDSYWNRATAGYFGRINYDYDGKYLFEFNIRYDGSSRFTKGHRWAWFPSFSAGWNIAREKFFEPLANEISTLKLRFSWGQLGNMNSYWSSFWDWYPFYQQQSTGNANSGWLIDGEKKNTASLPGIVNSSMTWETIESWNIGLDWAAFNNRFTGSFEVFRRSTKDMIGPAPVLGSVLGTNAPRTNNCDMHSSGWELTVGWKDRIGEVSYGVKFNISDAKSKIDSYPFDGAFGNQSINGYYNGKELGEIWGYESVGLAKTDEEMTAWLENNKPNWGSNWQAGDVMFKNLVDRKDADGNVLDEGIVNSGSGTLDDHGDLKVIGNTTPRYNFGITLNAEWKGIDFSIMFQGVMKRDWAFGQGDPYFWGACGGLWQSAGFVEHMDYWTEDNTGAYYPRPYFGGIKKNQVVQTRYLQSAAYMRCKNLQIGYSLPAQWISRIGMTRCRIYFSADNLFTITGLSDVFDPEAMSGAWGSGKLYPLQRTLSLGVNLSF